MVRKIIHVSLGACLGPMPGMGMNYNRTGVLARPQTFGISVFKSPSIQNSPESHETSGMGPCMVSRHGTYMLW